MPTAPANIANVRSRQEWADIINADWRKSIDSIRQTGRDLALAQSELSPDDFGLMVAGDLLFSKGTAWRLIKVANDPKIASVATSQLPPSWAVLSELTGLSENDFASAVQSGLIGPDTSARMARAITGAYGDPRRFAHEFEKGKSPSDYGHKLPTVGDPRKPAMLPSPAEARKVARETGRLVAASDGNTYSGATVEEGAEYAARRTSAFRVLEAINLLADSDVTASEWIARAEPHWLHDFRPGAIDDARAWLVSLKEAMGVIDAV